MVKAAVSSGAVTVRWKPVCTLCGCLTRQHQVAFDVQGEQSTTVVLAKAANGRFIVCATSRHNVRRFKRGSVPTFAREGRR